MELVRLSENTVIILDDAVIDPTIFARIQAIAEAIQTELAEVIIDLVPAYHSIHITFSLLKTSGDEFLQRIEKIIAQEKKSVFKKAQQLVVHIPVYYGDEVAEDFSLILAEKKITKDELINIHSEKIYDVYAIGFSPGFAYLGYVDSRIAMPRKKTPRSHVIKGSVAIADQQTAVYPSDSPGGWQIIGRTPLDVVNYTQDHPMLFSIGGKVKFDVIDREEYLRLGGVLP